MNISGFRAAGVAAALTLALAVAFPAPASAATSNTATPVGTGLRAALAEEAAVPRTGDPTLLAVTVRNDADAAAATGVAVRIEFGDGLRPAPTASGASPCTSIAATLSCSVGTLAPGATASLRVGVAVGTGTDHTIALFPPTSDQWDPLAGELLRREWDHERGAQGTPVLSCWPLDADSPDDTKAGTANETDCGAVDQIGAPDRTVVADALPTPFSERVTRSWEWRATIRPVTAVNASACLAGVDDGAVFAIDDGPGTALRPVLEVNGYTPGLVIGPALTLTAGTEYSLVIRVVNRGGAGADNGGMAPGGWASIGMTTSPSCATDATSGLIGVASGVASPARVPVAVVAATDLAVVGNGSGPLADGRRWAQARVVNRGPDRSNTTTITYDAPTGWTATTAPSSCLPTQGERRVRCDVGGLDAGDSSVLDFVLTRSSAADVLSSPTWAATTDVFDLSTGANRVDAGW